MKKYDTYKKVEVNGVETIPTHWKAIKLRWVCDQIFTGRTPIYSVETNDLLVFGQRNNQKWGIDFAGIKYADSDFFNSRKEDEFLKYGDVLLNTLGGGSVGRIGFYDVKDSRIITDGHVMIMRGKNISTQRYLYYFLSSQQKELEDAAVGSTNQAFLTTTQMNQWKVVVPPLSEQQAIVNYLDKKTGQIDKSISLLEAQKADLQAYRKAIISETVTKGLNPNAKLKDSGIQWIGQIPEEWSVVKMKHLLDGTLTYGANEPAESDNKEWPRYIRITDIAENGSLKESTFKSLSPDKAENYLLQKGDVLFARSGATVGKTFLFEENYPACFAGYLIKATPNKAKLNSKFLYFYTVSDAYESWKNSVYIQSTIQNIGADKYSLLPISIPSLSEQEAIVAFVDQKTSAIDTAIERINAQITELQAYRTALISEAVTGKIDVRP